MPVKRLPERNILPWQETHDSNSVQVSFTLKNYLEFCWLWFLGTFSAMIIIRGCTVGGWAQLKLTASLTLITSSVKKKKRGFLISWQHLCHTTRTPAAGPERPNKSFSHQPQTPMAEPIQLPRISTTLTHEDQKRREGRAKKAREESRRAPSGGRDVNT